MICGCLGYNLSCKLFPESGRVHGSICSGGDMLGGKAVIHVFLKLVCRCFESCSCVSMKTLSRRNRVLSWVSFVITHPTVYPVLSTLANFSRVSLLFFKLQLVCSSSRKLPDYSRMVSYSPSEHLRPLVSAYFMEAWRSS